MADVPVPPPPPVAIRITRPYASEDEYLDEELETLTRTSITLLGAQPRPQGIVLRFELVLASGQVLARGEGRVVGFKQNAHEGLGGLTLRFTRLDSRTKALVDKAAALREQRRPSTRPPLADAGPPAPPVSEPALSEPALETSMPEAAPSRPALSGRPPEPPARVPSTPPPSGRPPAPVPGPAATERETLLERLRVRAKALGPEALRQILTPRRGP